jgi:hypothetical protein
MYMAQSKVVKYMILLTGTNGEEPTVAVWRGCLSYNYLVSALPFFRRVLCGTI